MGDEQFAWLEATLQRAQEAGERVVLFGHFPAHPFGEHAMWGHVRFTALVTRFPNVLGYFNGHDHVGNYGELFERTLGTGSQLKIARGVNQLWNKGGLQYAPPIR